MTNTGMILLTVSVLCLLPVSAMSAAKTAPGSPASGPRDHALDGPWRLRSEPVEIDWRTRYYENPADPQCLESGYDDSGWLPAHVPGSVQFDCGLKDRWWGYDL